MRSVCQLGWKGERATVYSFDGGLVHGSPCVDLTDLSFVTAYGLVGLTCLLVQNSQLSVETRVILPDNHDVRNYLSRMRFSEQLERFCGAARPSLPTVKVSEREDRLLELRTFSESADIDKLGNLIWDRLDANGVDAQSLNAIYIGLGEIAENVLYHSGAGIGYVAAQTYRVGTPQETISIGIGDVGMGICKSLERYSPRSDHDAILKALELGTSATGEEGRGVGIPETVRVVTGLRGSVHFKTGEASVFKNFDMQKPRTTAWFKGTLIGIEVPSRPGDLASVRRGAYRDS